MEDFKTIYKILKILQKAMDYEEFDIREISAENLKISEPRWSCLIEMLVKEEYVQGITVKRSVSNHVFVNFSNPRITLKGLEYLNENSLMKKAANLAKGIREMI